MTTENQKDQQPLDLGFDIDAACKAALKKQGEWLERSCAQRKRRYREYWKEKQ